MAKLILVLVRLVSGIVKLLLLASRVQKFGAKIGTYSSVSRGLMTKMAYYVLNKATFSLIITSLTIPIKFI